MCSFSLRRTDFAVRVYAARQQVVQQALSDKLEFGDDRVGLLNNCINILQGISDALLLDITR